MTLFRTRVVPATDTTGTRVAVTYDGHTQFIGYDHGAPCAQREAAEVVARQVFPEFNPLNHWCGWMGWWEKDIDGGILMVSGPWGEPTVRPHSISIQPH